MHWTAALWRSLALSGLLIGAIVALLNTESVKNTVLVRIFDNSPDPDEPTEEEENARAERMQYYSYGSGAIPFSQDTSRFYFQILSDYLA